MHDKQHITRWGWLLVALVLQAAGPVLADWNWPLDNERYRSLTVFQRAQYDKAAELFKQKDYRAAAREFEKFKVQFDEPTLLPHILFMQAYSLHQAADRNQAIAIYGEVLDYFGEEVDFAAPALYFVGMAHFDNGDIRKGLEVMKEMAEDEDYNQHPLAAGALRRLANNHWKNKEQLEAVGYWKQVCRDFSKENPSEANSARASVTAYYVKEQDYQAIETWLGGDKTEEAAQRRWIANHVWDVSYGGFGGDWEKYTQFNKRERQEDVTAFYRWYEQQQPWYEQMNDLWTYHYRRVQFLAHRWADRKELEKAIDEFSVWLAKIEDKKDADGKYSWIIDRLRECHDWDRAAYCIDKMTDRRWATYKQYEIVGHGQGDWPAAVKILLELEDAGDDDWRRRAKEQRVYIYHHRIGQYKEAIDLYRELDNPPTNLWNIQDCYRRWGKLAEAISQLNEIENAFPDHAANAAWHKASYYHSGGDKENAIAQARRILKMYPKSGTPASNAHQLLEDYGIETGGGTIDGDL